eukprot:351824-Chlamydomonas_euryale.AAC.1
MLCYALGAVPLPDPAELKVAMPVADIRRSSALALAARRSVCGGATQGIWGEFIEQSMRRAGPRQVSRRGWERGSRVIPRHAG